MVKENNMDERILLGTIGVDSGQMMLVDPCYILSHWGEDTDFDEELQKEMQKSQNFKMTYNGACAATLQEDKHGGILEAGVAAVCTTGFGDGSYEVWLTISDERDWGNRVKKMEIIFIDDEEF